jgi:hypothetical protein
MDDKPGHVALGWKDNRSGLGLPRIMALASFYERGYGGHTEFQAGINIAEVMQQLYNTEYRFALRHKPPFVDVGGTNPFLDIVGGRYPDDEQLNYIRDAYQKIFEPQKVNASFVTAQRFIEGKYAGPTWLTRHYLEERLGNGYSPMTFYIFDPQNAGDLIDYWNFTLIARHVVPINLEWLPLHIKSIRHRITELS